MSSADGLREVCKCGHDKATHHEGKYNCLGLYCNSCKHYVNEWEEDAPVTPKARNLSWVDFIPPPSTGTFNWP